MLVIVQSLLGTVVQRCIPSILEYSSEVVSALDSCQKKVIRRQKEQQRQFVKKVFTFIGRNYVDRSAKEGT